ncbi:hypothetical protein [Thermoflexus sp.]|uniref:hypothetical protein n=1 Tax=Thermoflexus sp. TaxID=1969742 RepID=UPI001848FBF0|nr:hypothetical protein [Thermoflexus sp.]
MGRTEGVGVRPTQGKPQRIRRIPGHGAWTLGTGGSIVGAAGRTALQHSGNARGEERVMRG